jgi:transposase-like protein
MNEREPTTLIEAVRYFSDGAACAEYMRQIKWPEGAVTCPSCASDKVGRIETRNKYKCRDCKRQFTDKVDTIFEDSPLPLSSWFVAVWQIANCKNGVSSLELSRALGVTQKTAWFILHRIRLAMRVGTFRKMRDTVESDETFIGGRAENMHAKKREKRIQGRGPVGKAIVHGLLERGDKSAEKISQVRVEHVPSTEAETLMPIIAANVDVHAIVCTDAASSYAGLCSRYVHQFIDHATAYVRDKVHTNGIENFWSLLKRMLRGTYVAVAPFHLFRYLDEESWRFNERDTNDGGRFNRIMKGVTGRRLTYRQLCAIDDCGFMGIK